MADPAQKNTAGQPKTCPFTPPYPEPLAHKPGLLRRFRLAGKSWIHTLTHGAYGMKMGGTPLPGMGVYIINTLPEIRRLLDSEAADYPKHRIFDDLLTPLVGSSVFNANGAEWERQRTMVNPAFAHTHLARAFPVMRGAADDLVRRMGKQAGALPVDVDPMMTHVAADVIFRTMFSEPISADKAARVYREFETYQALAQRNTLLTLYGLPHFGQRWRARRVGAKIRSAFAHLIDARLADRATHGTGRFHDILETMLDMRHPQTGAGFERQDLVNQVTLIFFGGHETTATSLGWTLYLLAESQEWQDKARAQIEEICQGGPLTYDHLRKLDVLRAVYRESLRLYPPVSFIPREASHRETIRDKNVEQGDLLLAAPWLVHRNPDNWACPHQFSPERFTDPDSAKQARQAWIPFGQGPRVCIGAAFAQQEAAVVLASILRAFRLTMPEGAPRPELTARLTLRPKAGFPLVLTPL